MVRALYEIALDAQCSYSVEMQFVQVHIERIYDLLAERVSEHGHEVIRPLAPRGPRRRLHQAPPRSKPRRPTTRSPHKAASSASRSRRR